MERQRRWAPTSPLILFLLLLVKEVEQKVADKHGRGLSDTPVVVKQAFE